MPVVYLQVMGPYKVYDRGQRGITLANIMRTTENSCLAVGWKFHVAVDYRDIEKAWNVIKDILIREQIIESKIIPKTYLERMSEEELGREITINAFREDPDKNWRPVITEIEEVLRSAGVRQRNHCPATIPIPGCDYFSYRCDQRPKPELYEHLSEQEFYSRPSINRSHRYIDIDEALRIGGDHPANPYNFAIPDFINRLILYPDHIMV